MTRFLYTFEVGSSGWNPGIREVLGEKQVKREEQSR
jgi:hypothetical protein